MKFTNKFFIIYAAAIICHFLWKCGCKDFCKVYNLCEHKPCFYEDHYIKLYLHYIFILLFQQVNIFSLPYFPLLICQGWSETLELDKNSGTATSSTLLMSSLSTFGNNITKVLYSAHITSWHIVVYTKLSRHLTWRPWINFEALCTACTSPELAKFTAVTFMHICSAFKFH